MRKVISLLLLILALAMLTSCAHSSSSTIFRGNREEAIEAIRLLGSDMLAMSTPLEVKAEDIVSSIDSSYLIYKDHDPLYSRYQDEYLAALAEALPDYIYPFYDDVANEITLLSSSPEMFFESDTALSDTLMDKFSSRLRSNIVLTMRDKSEPLLTAFSSSEREFRGVRLAYLNLKSVGHEIDLVEASPISYEDLADILLSVFFSSLRNAETALKNQTIEDRSSSLYSLFWESLK